jgi:hypothetical protein
MRRPQAHTAAPLPALVLALVFVFLLVLALCAPALGQTAQTQSSGVVNTWDVPLTEILISQSRQGHGDHLELRNGQLGSAATVSIWKQRQDRLRELTRRIDERMNSVFVLAADLTLVYEVAVSFEEIVDIQERTVRLAVKHPYAAPLMLTEQERIVSDAWDLLRFVQLLALSYGDISRMKASSRQAVYRQLRDQMQAIKSRCLGLMHTLEQMDLQRALDATKVGRYVSQDRAIVREILKTMQ